MKVIFQILVILVVASLIGGVMYFAVNAGGTQTRTRGDFDGERPMPNGEFRPDHDGDREGREGGMMLPFGVVKSLVLMSVIGLPYYFITKRQAQKKRQPAVTPSV